MFEKWRERLTGMAKDDEEIQFKSFDDVRPAPSEPAVETVPTEEAPQTTESNIEFKIVRPEAVDEVFTIADYLISGCTVVVNFEALDIESVTRMIDFLKGVIYTTDSEMENVSPNTYILTPSGINVER
jgi:FtsZ-interacting cell division protein YlmF